MPLRVLSYNILSDTICRETAFLFKNVKDPVCSWPRRMDLILKEVSHYQADIIGMQVCGHARMKTVP
jgi:mRNA deadenylase 3'-5' endonuclease subunit Ccr4